MIIPANLIPNNDQIAHAVRWIVTTGGSLLTANGLATDSQVSMWSGIAITLTPLIQGAFSHTQAALLAKASVVPGVKTIEVLPNAPPNVQAVAADRSVPGVQPAAPYTNPYSTTSAQQRK
jgi:hypothetical protein